MRTILAWVLVACVLMTPAHALVQIDGFVTDAADMFTPEEEAELTAQLQTLFDSGRVEFAVVTTLDLEGMAIEDYSIAIVQEKLGDTEADNGFLLLIAPNEREYRIEVGRGLEGTLNDAKVGRVGRTYLVPAFREGDYARGVSESISAIDELTQGVEPANLEPDVAPFANRIWIVLLILFIVFQIIAAVARSRRSETYGRAAEVASWMFLRPPGGGGNGGFGGGLGGGGFGGGGFGGGGASGGW